MTSVLSLWNRSNVGMAALTLTFLRRKNSNGVSSSRHERIPRCVAKDPEEDNQREPGPQVKRWNEDSALRLAGDRAPGESEQAVHDERQCQHHQRIQLERRDWMQMKKLVQPARRTAARALEARQHTERTLGKELICRTRGIEEKKKYRSGGQPQPNRRGNCALSNEICSDVNKMKIRHDL